MTEILLDLISSIEDLIRENKSLNYEGSEELYGPLDPNKTLSQLNLKDVNEENYNLLLINFLQLAYEQRNKFTIRVLLEHFKGYLYTDLHIFLIILMNTDKTSEDDFLKFVLNSNEDITTSILIRSCIAWDSSPKIIPLVQKIEELLPQLSYDEWNNLYIYAVTEAPIDNTIMMDYMNSKLQTLASTKNIPKWIIKEKVSPVKSSQHSIFAKISPFSPSMKEVVDFFVSETSLPRHGIETQFLPEYRISTYEERCKMLKRTPEKELINIDEELFRRNGPLNIMNDNLGQDKDHPCYNGCRMLTCNHFSNYEEDMYDIDPDRGFYDEDGEGVIQEDWFIGNCMECFKKILKREYALRVPQLDGGWRGCYCSLKCLTTDIEGFSTFSSRMENQLNKIGIYDE